VCCNAPNQQAVRQANDFSPLVHQPYSELSDIHRKSVVNDLPRPLLDVRVSGQRVNWMPPTAGDHGGGG
jgi:hypothetical protein